MLKLAETMAAEEAEANSQVETGIAGVGAVLDT